MNFGKKFSQTINCIPVRLVYNIIRKGMKEMTEIKWIFVQEVSVMGVGYEEYISEDETLGKIVYDDGTEEIYEIA